MASFVDFYVTHAQTEPFDAINTIAQVILALTALIALVYAIQQYRLTKQRYAEDNRPYITIELERVTSGLLDIVILNSGNSAAKNVHVQFSPNIVLYEHIKTRVNSLKYLKNLKFLAAGKSLSFYFGSVIGGQTKIAREFKVTFTYEDVAGKKYEDEQVIDPRDFLGLVSIDRKGIHEAAKSLEEVKKELKSLNKNSEKMFAYFEKGLVSRDNSYNNLTLDELYNSLRNIITVGIEDVDNTFPMQRDAEIIAKIARNKLISKTSLTAKEKKILSALNQFESYKYDFEPEKAVNEFLEAIE